MNDIVAPAHQREAEPGTGRAGQAYTARTPAALALARTLAALVETVEDTVDGAVAGTDPERLHDLRVAVRRTRALLKLGGKLLDPELLRRYCGDWKWVGTSTGTARDLDVYLARVDDLPDALVAGDAGDLDPFVEHLRARRLAEHRNVAGVLCSKRFRTLLRDWRTDLAAFAASRTYAGDPVGDFAAARVRKTAKRVFRLAGRIDGDSPSRRIHDLRKRCKELRYALEFAAPLCAPRAHQELVKDLKRVQDSLGAFQDGEVQNAFLRAAAERMADTGRAPAATLLAMGELSARHVTSQRHLRRELPEVLDRFLGARSRIESLLP